MGFTLDRLMMRLALVVVWLLGGCSTTYRITVTSERPARIVAWDDCVVCQADQRPCEYRFERPWMDSSSRVFPMTALLDDGRCEMVLVEKETLPRRYALHFDLKEADLQSGTPCDVLARRPTCAEKEERQRLADQAERDQMHSSDGYQDRSGMGGLVFYGALFVIGTSAVALAVPRYIFSFDSELRAHGLLWELAFEKTSGERVALGHTFAASVACFPGGRESVTGRVTYRIWPLYGDVLRFAIGAGGLLNGYRAGPTVEARIAIAPLGAELRRLELFFGAAYELNVISERHHFGSFTAGLEFPVPLD